MDLICIAKANGATVSKTFFEGPHHVSMTGEQLHATIEQVCAPFVEALKSIRSEAYNDDECDFFNIADLALIDYRAIMGDKE